MIDLGVGITKDEVGGAALKGDEAGGGGERRGCNLPNDLCSINPARKRAERPPFHRAPRVQNGLCRNQLISVRHLSLSGQSTVQFCRFETTPRVRARRVRIAVTGMTEMLTSRLIIDRETRAH